jgi:serine protease Do
MLAFHQTIGLEAAQRPVHHHAARADHGRQIPSLRDRVAALGRGETPNRLRLGVAVAPAHVARRLRRSVGLPERDGLLVRGVEEGSLAERAGVQEGDLIVAAGGRPIADVDDLHDALGSLEPPFELTLVRGAEESTVTVPAEPVPDKS